MSDTRRKEIGWLLAEALVLPEGERDAFLRLRIGEDPQALALARSLLVGQASATIGEAGNQGPVSNFSSSDLAEGITQAPAAGPRLASEPASGRDERIGSYRLMEILGEGGMGVVYLAEQERPRRTVALKVIRPGLTTPRLLRRFELESQVLGRLQHPGIAQIYEAGIADLSGTGALMSGRPFFAMELVRGLTLTEHARTNGLSVAERLAIFVRICEAVQHAHQRGVIHRDLKPGNILVDSSGQPKVLDFGVARAADAGADGEEGDGVTMQTDAGQLVGTLPYMSPEQVMGGSADLDTRSDVYALGVIRFELLSGRLPHAVSNKTIVEAARIIGEDAPANLRSVDRSLHPELAVIVHKALEKDRARRYQSASELGEDVGRFLRSEPILARPPSAAYQLRKFAARNKGLVAALIAAVIMLAGTAVGTSILAADLRVQRNTAIAQTTRAESTSRFLQQMILSVTPEEAGGREPTVREIVDVASMDVDRALADSPEAEASVRLMLAQAYHALGKLDAARPQYEQALSLATSLFGEGDARTLVATRGMSGLLSDRGEFDEAERLAQLALNVTTTQFGEHSGETALSRMNVARVLQETGRSQQARPMMREALADARAAFGDRHPEVVTALHNLGTMFKDMGDTKEGIPLLREALKLRIETVGEDHPHTLYTKNNLAAALQRDGQTEEALTLIRETLAARERVLGKDHPATITSRSNLSVALIEAKRFEEALPLAQGVYTDWTGVLGEDHPKTMVAMGNLAYLLEDLGRLDEAESLYRKAIEIRKQASGGKDPETWAPMNNLAMLLQKRGDLTLAEEQYRELISLCESALPPDHIYTAIFRSNFGECLGLIGKRDEATKVLQVSLEVLEKKVGPDHARTIKARERLATLAR